MGEREWNISSKYIYDTSIKVPAIVSYPGKILAGVRCDDLSSVYDFMPTLLEYFGLPVLNKAELSGRNMVASLTGEKSSN
ncbi:MAG TPA: sulfatase/phosphatase domain-containing protein [Pseudogracilibacillus sp.]|nr:sulfatase/phosphatase domain-containing protein [Pseudogracilibacillus sp.]